MSKRQKTSYLWSYFSVKDAKLKIAKCDLCGQDFCYKSTISNLRKHMERKHSTVNMPTFSTSVVNNNADVDVDDPAPIDDATLIDHSQPSSSGMRVDNHVSTVQVSKAHVPPKQTTLSSFMSPPKNIYESQKKLYDRSLLKLFTKDFQPFSIVEDKGFSNFIKVIKPEYNLPSRQTISKSLIPAEYEKCMTIVRHEIHNAPSLCLTTDIWTSQNTDSYIGLTGHYINTNFELKSALLQCSLLTGSHTAEVIATKIKEITDSFHVTNKILVVITDNAANMKAAVLNELHWKHFGCLAHTLNLIAQNALEAVKDVKSIREKIRSIVGFFKRSTIGNETLMSEQRCQEPRKLLQEVITRWNSTYYMLERIVSMRDPVKRAIAVVNNKTIPVLTEDEWVISADLCEILAPFEEVTAHISGQKYVTGSEILIIVKNLKLVYENMKKEAFHSVALDLVKELHKGLTDRFQNIENSKTVILSALLDPRYKELSFTTNTSLENAKKHAISLLAKLKSDDYVTTTREMPEANEPETELQKTPRNKFSIWKDLDKTVSSLRPKGTPTSDATIELDRYLKENHLARSDDPLLWWKRNQYVYPTLSKLVRQHFNFLATSVPCERIFSKAGTVISERRTRLKPNNVEKILFLNVNSN